MAFQWQWEVFLQDPGGKYETYLSWLMSAWGWTIAVSLCGLLVAIIIGAVIGTLRTLPDNPWWRRLGDAWVELFRNIPLLVQIFLWYHVIPALIPPLKQAPPFILVVLALGFFTSARIAEQVRSGIQTRPKGQRYAAMALGMTTPQAYRLVILPVAFRTIIPPLTSEFMGIFKNSSVAFAVSIAELIMFARQVTEETTRFYEVYIAVTALYIISAYIINIGMTLLEKRLQIPGLVSASGGGH